MVQGSKEWFEKMFPIVEASKLSLVDEFMKHEPKTGCQRRLKESLTERIKAGLQDFRRPVMDPAISDNEEIVYQAGLKPAKYKREAWWYENAKKFMPERNSRLGTENQYVAFLGVLIKYLINEMGYTVSRAWEAVCDDSKEIGHYADSENKKDFLETTGSSPVGIWFDLGNTGKLIVTRSGEIDLNPPDDSSTDFLIAGGDWRLESDIYPLFHLEEECYSDVWTIPIFVGWIVMDV